MGENMLGLIYYPKGALIKSVQESENCDYIVIRIDRLTKVFDTNLVRYCLLSLKCFARHLNIPVDNYYFVR